jgi:amino acid transporter
MFKILFSYSGWQNANYVLNEVKNPIRTIKIAGPLGLGITSALYIFANIAYFAYVRSSLHLLDQRRLPIVINVQCIVKGRHSKVWNDRRISVF